MGSLQAFLDTARGALHGVGLTPLQAQEIEQAIEAHEKCNLVDNASLRDHRDRVEAHWTAIASSLARRGGVQVVLRLFADSFAGLLLEEYFRLDLPPLSLVPMRHYLKMFGPAEERKQAADILTKGDESRLDPLYENTIVLAITELLLDREHVETRLRNAAAGTKLTEMLLRAEDEVRLMDVIEKDLASLRQLVKFRPVLGEAQHCINARAQGIQRQSQPSGPAEAFSPISTTTSEAPSFWRTLGSRLGFPSTLSPAIEGSLSSACRLLSDDELAKKTA